MTEIVVGYDSSTSAELALRWAVREAALREASLHVVQSWREPLLIGPTGIGMWYDPGNLAVDLAETLRATIGQRCSDHPDVTVSTSVVPDSPARALLDRSAEADLLVVGARGRGGFLGLQLGSVSGRVARRAEVPVVVVRGDETPFHGDVVIGVDGSACSRSALAWAAVEARRREVKLEVLLAWSHLGPQGADGPEPFRSGYGQDDAEAALASIVADVLGDDPDQDVVSRAVCDLPSSAVLDASRDAGLVVVGRHGTSRWAPYDLGSTSQAVLSHAEVPVAVIPGPEA